MTHPTNTEPLLADTSVTIVAYIEPVHAIRNITIKIAHLMEGGLSKSGARGKGWELLGTRGGKSGSGTSVSSQLSAGEGHRPLAANDVGTPTERHRHSASNRISDEAHRFGSWDLAGALRLEGDPRSSGIRR